MSMTRTLSRCLVALLPCCLAIPGCTRPMHFGPVALHGLKGVNHLTSQADTDYPLDVLRLKLVYATDASLDFSRGPHVQPWMFPTKAQAIRDRFDLVRKAGIEQVVVVGADPHASLDDWRRHCRAVAHLLPASYFGIENEPDNSTDWPPARYARWLHAAAEEIRAVRPTALICAPSLGHGKVTPPERFLCALDPDDFDILTIHPYGKGWPYVRKCLRLVPKKMVWIEEDGAIGLFATAAMRGSFHEYLKHPRITALFWYCLCDYAPACRKYNLLDYRLVDGLPVFTPRRLFQTFKEIR